MKPGKMFGELGLLQKQLRAASIISLENNIQLAVLYREEYKLILESV